MVSLYSMRALAAVHEAGSITLGAQRLGVSQPALTRAIRQLEEDVGFALLERQPRGVVVTEQGRALLGHAQLLSRLEREASAEVGHWLRSRPSEVRLAASSVAVATLVPAALRLLRRSSDDVRVRIVEAAYPAVAPLFRDDRIDLAIGPLPPPDLADRFRIEWLFDVPLMVAIAKGHRLRRTRKVADLAGARWVIDGSIDESDDAANLLFAELGIPVPQPLLISESIGAALQFVEGEGFVGLIPQPLAVEAREAGRIDILAIEGPLPSRRLGMFHPLRSPLSAASRALYSALRLAVDRGPARGQPG